MSHTNSQTWVNPLVAERDKFELITTNVSRLFVFSREESPFYPRNLAEWLDHREVMARARATLITRRLTARECYFKVSRSANPPLKRPFDGRVFRDNLTSVTAERTMWCKRWEHLTGYEASWPSIAELKYEGEDRAESFVGRYLPLPRFRANETVPAKDCISLPESWPPFDMLNKVPTEDDVLSRLYGVDEVLEQDIPNLIGATLLAALDPEEVF